MQIQNGKIIYAEESVSPKKWTIKLHCVQFNYSTDKVCRRIVQTFALLRINMLEIVIIFFKFKIFNISKKNNNVRCSQDNNKFV